MVTCGSDVNNRKEGRRLAGVCTKCGNTAFKVQSASYVLSADGSTLVAVSPMFVGDFTAQNIDGAKVTKIGRGAFSHNLRITSVTLENVTELGAYAFGFYDTSRPDRRSHLRTVSLGELTYIGEYAFYGILITEMPAYSSNAVFGEYAFSRTALTEVIIPDGAVIAEGMFAQCPELETVVIGNNVTIGAYAFYTQKDDNFSVNEYTIDGTKYFYYVFSSALKNITIGDNATIGESAFNGAASVETIQLGAGAKIGYMAFYNCSSLKEIDLSKALSIGDYAFSGDTYYICRDENMSVAAVGLSGADYGKYLYSYHGHQLENVDLSSADFVGTNAFAVSRQLKTVLLGDGITEIGGYAFASCPNLESINLDKVQTIGEYAFMESGLMAADLSAATQIGKYAFVNSSKMTNVTLSAAGSEIGEGAFAYTALLTAVQNLEYATKIDAYAFAYSGLTAVDLSGAGSIGDFAFMKEKMTDFTVTLGAQLVSLGDNPFAMCVVAPFFTTESETFNGVEYTVPVYDFQLSDTVYVVDGSLYCQTPNGGLELITYTGRNADNVILADGTVRITGQAFAGSAVERVTLPYTVESIGHKAFYGCKDLKMVIFTSFRAPILEEEFDPTYYEGLEHIPGTGNYGSYTDYDGTEVMIKPAEIVPYFMWNATGGMYSNCYYGANFIDYVGYVENKPVMVRPSNGQGYETFIMEQYFAFVFDGSVAAEDMTLDAIEAINRIPGRVELKDEAVVVAARVAYDKVLNKAQQALVSNYATLLSAEQRILALKNEGENKPNEEQPPVEGPAEEGDPIMAVVLCVVAALVGAVAIYMIRKNRKAETAETADETTETEDAVSQEETAQTEE